MEVEFDVIRGKNGIEASNVTMSRKMQLSQGRKQAMSLVSFDVGESPW